MYFNCDSLDKCMGKLRIYVEGQFSRSEATDPARTELDPMGVCASVDPRATF